MHVRSFSKSHGPDLRIAALGGPRDLVDRIVARRMLGPGWTSRMLQTILLDLLTDGTSLDAVTEAAAAVLHAAARRSAMRCAPRGVAGHAGRRHQPLDAGAERARRRSCSWRRPASAVAAGTPFLAASGRRMPRRQWAERGPAATSCGSPSAWCADDAAEVADALATAAQHLVAGGY